MENDGGFAAETVIGIFHTLVIGGSARESLAFFLIFFCGMFNFFEQLKL